MAQIKKGILTGASGRIGNLVVCERYGKSYIRTLPSHMNHPNSDKQLAQRMRFAVVQQFLKPVLKFIKITFVAYADGRSGYSSAMSYNLNHALKGTYPNITLDYALARVSYGKLPTAQQASIHQTAPNTLTITWQGQTQGKGAKDTDFAAVLLFSPDSKFSWWTFHAGSRSAGQAVVVLPETHGNKPLLGYLCFMNSDYNAGKTDLKNISESVWCGEVEVN